MKKRIIIILAWCLTVDPTGAQPVDTLISVAMQGNPELRGLYLEYRAMLEQVSQVNELPDPEVGLGISILPVETRLGPQWVRLGVTQMFPWMGTLQAREEVVLAMARSRYEQVEALKLDLVYQVRQAYYGLYELRRSEEIISRNLQLFRGIEQMALARVESGRASVADVLQVRLRIQEMEQRLLRLENQESKPLAALNRALNRPPATPVTVVDTLALADLALDRDTLAVYIRSRHPMMEMLGRQQEASRQSLALNDKNRKPAFGVGLDYIFTGKRSDAEPMHNGRDALGVRGSVRIPIFTNKYGAKEQEEKLKIEALESRKLDLENKFLASAEQAFADYQDALLQLDLYRRQQQTLQAAIGILQTGYSNEGGSIDELLRLQVEETDYDLRILQAIVQSHLAKAEVEKLTDNPGAYPGS